MTSLQVNKGDLPSSVTLPRSKSHANRALILSALSSRSQKIKFLPEATDVKLLVGALKKIGLKIENSAHDAVVVSGSFPSCENDPEVDLDVGEGGTTARFLACLLLLGKSKYRLHLGLRLKQRPWDEFLHLVRSLGAQATLIDNILTVQGPVHVPSTIDVDCSRTTQFATGVQLALGWQGVKVIPKNLKTSLPYWQMTISMIEQIKSQDVYEVPLDWSSSSYPLAFGALNHPISFPGLKLDPNQADCIFADILTQLGALKIDHHQIQVQQITISKDLKIDVSHCLDLVPALVYFLSHVKGVHELYGIHNLQFKESDRLTELESILTKFERKFERRSNSFIIYGDPQRISSPKNLLLPDDHRIVMTGALFLRHHGGGTVGPIESVAKSYPDFPKLLA